MDEHTAVHVVTAHVWRIEPRRIPATLITITADRARLGCVPGVHFAKILGSSNGFGVREADLRRWVMLASWTSMAAARAFDVHPLLRRWQRRATESWTATLLPVNSRGRWSRRQPFGTVVPCPVSGPVVAITRARLVGRKAVQFWRAVPAVAADLHARPGLRLAFGIGEAPVGVQGTFSIWDDASALRGFAYAGRAHSSAIAQTASVRWYAEELFARFAVLDSSGTIDGVDPVAA